VGDRSIAQYARFRRGSQEEDFLWVPHHGPVLSIDEDAGAAISMKSLLQESTTDLQFFVNVGRVSSMEDAKQHFALSFTLIDIEGNIAFFPFAELPRREWDTSQVPAWTPLPGNGDYEWGEDSTTGELEAMYWLLVDDMMLSRTNYWDNEVTDFEETRPQIVTEALTDAEAILSEKFESSDPDDWRWGRIHTVTLTADLLSSITPEFNNGPYATVGGRLTVNVANPSGVGDGSGSYSHRSGASMRMIVEGRSDGMVGHFQLAGGQIHRRDSPNYDDLLQKWLAHEYVVMPFTSEQVDDAAVEFVEVVAEP
jgi:acyl-homoserine lactone acylase PvdQ